MKEKPWRLVVGSHAGTVMSRDVLEERHNSLKDCEKSVGQFEKEYGKRGLALWYATAYGPKQEKVEIRKASLIS